MKHTLTTLLLLGMVITCPLSACGSNLPPDIYDEEEKVQPYYELDYTKGFEIYAWNRGGNTWRSSLNERDINGKAHTYEEVVDLYPVSLPKMKEIIDFYASKGFEKDSNIVVCIVSCPLTAESLEKSYKYDESLWSDIDYVRESLGLEKLFE